MTRGSVCLLALWLGAGCGDLGAGCGSSTGHSGEQPDDDEPGGEHRGEHREDHEPRPEPRLVEIIAGDYDFNSSHIIARPGERLIVRLRNEGSMPYSVAFALPSGERALESAVQPQRSAELTLRVPRQPGEYVYYSPLGEHRERGMAGALVVRPPPRVELVQVARGLTSPLAMAVPPDGSGRRFIVDQIGLIWILTPGGELMDEPFLDLRKRVVDLDPEYDERGLLGMAFHPRYAVNGRFFVFYSAPLQPGAPDAWNHTTRISEFRVSRDDPDRADSESEEVLLHVDQPQMNHNGGTLLFGPRDGYLYMSLGDGGSAGDEGMGHTPGIGNAQDRTNLMGSILRVDVDRRDKGGAPYAIPPDNPFVGDVGRAEIYAYGLRNPYRMAFDRADPDVLLAGDAGQELWEEVTRVVRGGNHGWRMLEGTHCFSPDTPMDPPARCADVGPYGERLLWPVIEVPNSTLRGGLGRVVVGGYVYRGRAIPELAGRYVFAMWSRGHGEQGEVDGHEHGGDEDGHQDEDGHERHAGGQLLVASDMDGEGDDLWPIEHIDAARGAGLDDFVLGFGEDASGELYVLTTANHGPTGHTGKVFAIAPR